MTPEELKAHDELKMLAWMESEYVRCGYMYSGSVGPDQYPTLQQFDNEHDRVVDAFEALEAAGIARRRDCRAWTYELVPARRVDLIEEHNLDVVWQRKAPYFYPNDPSFGEVPRVRAAAALDRKDTKR